MASRTELIKLYKSEVLEALNPLIASWEKLKNKNMPDLNQKNLDELESWEALTARFARTTDIFLSKYSAFNLR